MPKPKEITLKSRDVTKKTAAPLDIAQGTPLNRVNVDQVIKLMRDAGRAEAMVQVADFKEQIETIDKDIEKHGRAKHRTSFDNSLIVHGLHAEKKALQNAMKRLIDRHFPVGVI